MFGLIEAEVTLQLGKLLLFLYLLRHAYTGLTRYICSCFVAVVVFALIFVFVHINEEFVIDHCH